MKGIKNRILLEIQNYQSVLNTKSDCKHLAESLTEIIIREMKTYLYQLNLPAPVSVQIAEDLNIIKAEPKFNQADIRKAVQLARHTVSNEDQILKTIEDGTQF